jgi:TctA family transporter
LTLIPVILGLFAGAELIDLAAGGQPIVPLKLALSGKAMRHQINQGMLEVFRHLKLFFRSCIMGYIMGIAPGVGQGAATFIAYAQAKQSCKNPETFGTGRIEGVIAPESCSNAKEGASLLSTIALGLPSGPSLALIMGALLMGGVMPGPLMLRDELKLSFTLFWGLALGNIIGGIGCYFTVGYLNFTKLITMAPRYLVAIILPLCLIGAFIETKDMGNVIVAIVFSVIGLGMKKLGFNRPAMTLGFLMGAYLEQYLWLSLQTQGPFFFLRPVSLAIGVIIIFLYLYGPLKSLLRQRKNKVV